MARKYPTSINRHSAGSNTLFIVNFDGDTTSGAGTVQDDIDNGDTYVSGIPEVVNYWTNATDDPTQTKEGIDAAYSNATPDKTGLFTFYTGEANRIGKLFILAKA